MARKKNKRKLIIIALVILVLLIGFYYIIFLIVGPFDYQVRSAAEQKFDDENIEIVFNEPINTFNGMNAAGIIIDGKRSAVFTFSGLTNDISDIEKVCEPENESELIAFTAVTDHSGDFEEWNAGPMVPGEIKHLNGTLYEVKFYDGYDKGCEHMSYGYVTVDISNNDVKFESHVE